MTDAVSPIDRTLAPPAEPPRPPGGESAPYAFAAAATRLHPRLVLFGPAPVGHGAGDPIVAMPDWEAFLLSGEAPLGFVVAVGEPSERDAIARAIRRSRYWDRLAFETPTPTPSALLDGVRTPDEARQACELAEARRRSLGSDTAALDFEERLLHHLYLRESAELVPARDRNAPLLYRWPLPEALASGGIDVDQQLRALVQRRLLEPGALLDRTRHCRACSSAHLHFLDVCPHCTSLQIERTPSLHCFTCGHVAPEARFREATGALACPRCSTRLRHVGVDYDRPVAQLACNDCQRPFTEAAVVAHCLDCGAEAEPAALEVREVRGLRLSPHGRAAVRAGQLAESFAALDTANHVVPDYFRHLVDWALVTQARHPALHFALVLVRFRNAAELVAAHGASRAFLMLDEFARRLHETLRASDVTTRTEEAELWIFLPFTAAEALVARLRQLFDEQAVVVDGPPLEAGIRALQLPGDAVPGACCEQLMARLRHAVDPQAA